MSFCQKTHGIKCQGGHFIPLCRVARNFVARTGFRLHCLTTTASRPFQSGLGLMGKNLVLQKIIFRGFVVKNMRKPRRMLYFSWFCTLCPCGRCAVWHVHKCGFLQLPHHCMNQQADLRRSNSLLFSGEWDRVQNVLN